MVRINRVYTKTGDAGQTALIGGQRVGKDSPRIECYGTVDELNATLGLARTALETSPAGERLLPVLDRVQNELFNLGAQLATPEAEDRAKMPAIEPRHIEALETLMDELNESLPALKSFILPGGGQASACFHMARTVCRRAERLVVAVARDEEVEAQSIIYLNRLSDALFVMGRWAAAQEGRAEPLWTPEST
ncbi:cob(I)yrinic acid a,c-diamide adenosyltransferase [Haliangium sp.]|uniref:cob(I)yrinic acid a,c-diamide adenosyltransferase n=1 Tax=Haliangium sp. TaxID=2663208 RepID=UPI003D123D90